MKKTLIALSLVLLSLSLFSCASSKKEKKQKKEAPESKKDTEFFGNDFVSDMKDLEEYEFSGEEEYFIGRTVAASVLEKYPVYDDPAATFYVNQVLQALIYDSDARAVYNGYHAVILDSDELNAFATPGGHIFITKGLFLSAGSEDALAAILAHELAHVQKQHGLETIRADRAGKRVTQETSAISKKLSASIMEAAVESKLEKSFSDIPFGKKLAKKTSKALTDTFIESDLFANIQSSIEKSCDTLFITGYSQQNEFDADETALFFLYSSGYNVNGLREMLMMMDEFEKNNKSSGGMFSTHPKPKTRLKKVESKIKKYPETQTDPSRTKRYNENK